MPRNVDDSNEREACVRMGKREKEYSKGKEGRKEGKKERERERERRKKGKERWKERKEGREMLAGKRKKTSSCTSLLGY